MDRCVPVLQLPAFEGSIELLLNLVERRRLPITEVSLATVADQYLEHVRALDHLDSDALSAFLVVAARLILLKSRALLPHVTASDEQGDESPEDLVLRLTTYRAFRLLADALADRERAGLVAYGRGSAAIGAPTLIEQPLQPIEVAVLRDLARVVQMRDRPTPTESPALVARVPVADRLAVLRAMIVQQQTVNWQDVCGRTVDEAVATLLAVLEMVRRGELLVEQPDLFGPILLIRPDQSAVPSSA